MPYPLGQTPSLLSSSALRSISPSLIGSLKTDGGRGYEVGASERSREDEERRKQQFETAGAAIDAALRQAAEQEAAAEAARAAEEAKPFYVKKYGPLPFWAWAAGGATVLTAGFILLRRRS